MKTSYLTVGGEDEAVYEIERSKFIAYVRHVENESEAKEFVAKIRKMNSLATHNVYAYITDVDRTEKFSDDNEPQGTAGFAVLGVLKNQKLFNTAVVVTRYFGGIKLGTGGLKRAYEKSTTMVLSKVAISEMKLADLYLFTLSYEDFSKMNNLIIKYAFNKVDVVYENSVKVVIAVEKGDVEGFNNKISDAFCGTVKGEKISEKYITF